MLFIFLFSRTVMLKEKKIRVLTKLRLLRLLLIEIILNHCHHKGAGVEGILHMAALLNDMFTETLV